MVLPLSPAATPAPPAPPAPRQWRLRHGQRLAHREWADEFVVFNDLTGDCHLLDGAGFAVLQHLRGVAQAAAAQLAAEFDDLDPADPAALAQIEQVLAGLVSCDLVEELP